MELSLIKKDNFDFNCFYSSYDLCILLHFRCWTRITSDLVGMDLSDQIPDTDPYFLEYGPDFTLAVTPTNVKNSNTKKNIEDLLDFVKDNLNKIVL